MLPICFQPNCTLQQIALPHFLLTHITSPPISANMQSHHSHPYKFYLPLIKLKQTSLDVISEMESKGEVKDYHISSVSSLVSLRYVVVLLWLCVLPGALAQCGRKPVIFNFGDSNSDTGGFAAAHGVTFGPPFGRAFFHEQNSRASDGRLMVDFLCEFQFSLPPLS